MNRTGHRAGKSMKKKFNILMFACISAVIGAVASATFAWDDIATFFGSTSDAYNICFGVQSVNDIVMGTSTPQFSQFRRTRREDGSQDFSQYTRAQWTLSSTLTSPQGNFYCTPNIVSPRQGHYVYELRLCPTDPTVDATNCSPWISSADPTVAQINGQQRAWWIYNYIDPKAPSAPTVTAVPSAPAQ